MEQTQNRDSISDDDPYRLASESNQLAVLAVDPPEFDQAPRRDGWTPERIRIFLHTLSEHGIVAEAAQAAGMSVAGAYKLRNRSKGRAFHLAWNGALALARRRLADVLLSRAIHGTREITIRDGRIWSERHRHDNWLAVQVLNRLDRKFEVAEQENGAARMVADEFDQFVDIASGGGDAASFIAEREPNDNAAKPSDEPALLERLASYESSDGGDGTIGQPEGRDP